MEHVHSRRGCRSRRKCRIDSTRGRWLASDRPDVEWFGSWNEWAVALLGCIIFDVFSGREAAGANRRRTPDDQARRKVPGPCCVTSGRVSRTEHGA